MCDRVDHVPVTLDHTQDPTQDHTLNAIGRSQPVLYNLCKLTLDAITLPRRMTWAPCFKGFAAIPALVLGCWKGRKKDKDSPTPIVEEPLLYLEDSVVNESIVRVDFEQYVKLPSCPDRNEWLATHTISFFEHINLIYGTVSQYCTCPTMTGPANVQYLWFDEKGKKCKCPASQYVDFVMTFIQKTVLDESIFPTKYGNQFPGSFESIVKKIYRLLFHVLSHVYHAHFREIVQFGLHGHLNTLFTHFMVFMLKFSLVEEKDTEVHILDNLLQSLKVLHCTTSDKQSLLNSDRNSDIWQPNGNAAANIAT